MAILRHIENPGIVRTVYSEISGILRNVQQYSAMLRHTKGYLDISRHT